jgi:hypothetical protein
MLRDGGAQPSCKPIEVRAAPTTILKCLPNERLSIDTAGLDERCLTSPALGWSAYAVGELLGGTRDLV